MTEILKVQVSLMSNGDSLLMLVYNESRAQYQQMVLTDEVKELAVTHGPRFFVEGQLDDWSFKIHRVVGEQGW